MENEKDQNLKQTSVEIGGKIKESLTKYQTQLSVRIDPEVKKSLKFIAVEHDKTLTNLFMEAIHDLLKKYKKKAKD